MCFRPARAGYCCSLAALLLFVGSETLQNAVADGETRTISFHHIHTKEDLTVTYKRNGRYDEAALRQINHLMRDWREDEPIKMNPHLIDLLWEVNREVGGREPIRVICGYRSPDTNAKLRRRSRGVAKLSQHMRGNAIDFSIPGVALEDVRAAGLRAERGGVGFYPSSGFVHMDTGSVRHWPRIPEEQLARVMAKGPLSSQSVAVAQTMRRPAFLAKLFGGGNDEEDQGEKVAAAKPTVVASAAQPRAEKPAAKPADKPAEKLASVPVPPTRPGKQESMQLASASGKPSASPDTFKVASATSRTVAFVKRDGDGFAVAPAKFAGDVAGFERATPPSAQAASLVARADLTPSDVINERGFWQGLPSMEPLEAPPTRPMPAAAVAHRHVAVAIASVDPKATGSLAPWPLPGSKEPVPTNALAYAAQPTPIAQARWTPPMGSGSLGSAAAPPHTTVAVKRGDERPTPAPHWQAKGVQVVRVGDRFNDPWMRAMIISPSAQGFMRTTLYGVQDFRAFGLYLQKPVSSVMMTFSDDPHLGMSSEKFAGTAVVFVATVTFKTRTAALR